MKCQNMPGSRVYILPGLKPSCVDRTMTTLRENDGKDIPAPWRADAILIEDAFQTKRDSKLGWPRVNRRRCAVGTVVRIVMALLRKVAGIPPHSRACPVR
jgi:hypothetical protein